MPDLKPYQAYSHRIHGACCDHPDLYGVWCSMKSRCENPNRPKFKDYGNRGIEVCEEWQDSWNFVQWAVSHGYRKGLQLDRIDNDKGYSPDNCRFVTPKENSRNRRNTKFLTIKGEKNCHRPGRKGAPLPIRHGRRKVHRRNPAKGFHGLHTWNPAPWLPCAL